LASHADDVDRSKSPGLDARKTGLMDRARGVYKNVLNAKNEIAR
jgi:hypothetical protein